MFLPKMIVAVNKKHNLILFYMGNNQGSTEKRLEHWDTVVQLSKSNLYQCRLNIQRRKMTLTQFRKWSQQHYGPFSSHTTIYQSHMPSQQWHVGPRWGLHGRQMWAPLWACTRDPHWGQPWKPRRTKSGTCKGTAWVLIGQFMSARFGPHLPKGVKSGFAPGIHMGASRGCPDGF